MFVPFAEMKVAPFATYDEIPVLTREYIVYVTGEKELETVPLDDINSFMLMIYDAEKQKRDEWEDGWVL
jgi:hypothetical protein